MNGKQETPTGQTAVVAVSRAGSALALRLAAALPHAVARVPARFLPPGRPDSPRSSTLGYDGPVAPFIAALFARSEALVLVMAAGAAVRLLAPLLRDKGSDPAVVVVDDAGRFAISLLGGHAAGANALALEIAGLVGATPVLTTATETVGAPEVEAVARVRGWRLEPGSAVTALLGALVNADCVAVFQDAGDRGWLSSAADRVRICGSVAELTTGRPDAALIVTDRTFELPAALAGRTVVYRPPVLVFGVGCSRGATCAEIAGLVDATLDREELSPLAVAALATIDRRRDEPGLRELSAERSWPIVCCSSEALAATPGDWSRSEVVQRAIGTPAVAEPAALAVAGVSRLLVRKVKSAHATLAIARSPVELRFV